MTGDEAPVSTHVRRPRRQTEAEPPARLPARPSQCIRCISLTVAPARPALSAPGASEWSMAKRARSSTVGGDIAAAIRPDVPHLPALAEARAGSAGPSRRQPRVVGHEAVHECAPAFRAARDVALHVARIGAGRDPRHHLAREGEGEVRILPLPIGASALDCRASPSRTSSIDGTPSFPVGEGRFAGRPLVWLRRWRTQLTASWSGSRAILNQGRYLATGRRAGARRHHELHDGGGREELRDEPTR